ncbi:MAG TPA: B-box zinc finger protein, partial [Verrucomicrobiae bacterium]
MGVKLRCGCGQKVELEVTPESLPIQFVCPTCSADNSVVANQVLRQMFGIAEPATTPAPVAAAAPARLQLSPTASPAATATPAPAMRIQTQAQAASASAAPAIACAAEPAAAPTCPKHHHQPVMNYCVVCQKPMCGKCMEVFGYVCSAFCRGKAEAQKIDVPVYLNQRTVSEAHFGRKVMRSSLAIAGGLALVAAVWVWWAWFATVPKPEYSVAFAESSPSGHARLGALNQLIVLHGDTLARYDLKAKREIWSKKVLDKELIASAAGPALAQMQKSREAAIANGASPFDIILPSMKDIQDDLVRSAEASLQLQMQRENVWLRFPEKLIHYDWNSGAAVQEIAMTDYFGYFTRKDGELVSIIDSEAGGKMITRIDLTSGELKKEQITAGPSTDSSLANARPGAAKTIAGATVLKTAAGAPKFTSNQLAMAARLMTNSALMAGLARNGKKPLDPQAVAKQYQNLPLSAKLAVPAVVAANANQQRLMDELDSDMEPAMNGALAAALKGMDNTDRVSIIPAAEGFAEFSVKLLEQKTVERKVMKAPPKKSALDGNVTAGNSMSAANEVLNEMQRDLV